MDAAEIVDALAETTAGDMVYVNAEGVSEWFSVESATMEYDEPEEHKYGWDEGSLLRHLLVPDELEGEMELVYFSSVLSSRTVDGEWRRPTMRLPERWQENPDHPDDWIGEERNVKSVTVVPKGMWQYREEAVEEARSLRSDGVKRVVYSDAVVRYVADERGVDVAEFVARLEAADLGEQLDEYGVQMFPFEIDVIDVSERTRADVLSALRYFRCS